MRIIPNRILILICLVGALVYAASLIASEASLQAKAHIEYSQKPGTEIISFREIFPEFADQDPTPLIRIYNDGRVVVFHPSYMKQAGQYEMMMPRNELDELLLRLTPALMDFDPEQVRMQKKASDEMLWASTPDWKEITLFHDSDAEISVFQVNIDAYYPNGKQGPKISKPNLERSWRGLRFDARDYSGIESIQSLMQVERSLKALARHGALVRVESPQ